MSGLFNTTSFRLAEQGLSVLNAQAQIISQNIANAETPNYKCKYLYFEGVLKEKLEQRETTKYTKELHLGTAVYTDNITKDQPDGNNVDNDTQQALLVKARLQYDTLYNQLNSEFNLLRTAMRKT